ncbi:hypothetical protein H072_129 [Dactylellina haptotyla CBS 200.50]|uniref:Peptidase S8/S53 domain-containing protein n=1 Tax=Dactylellina haptotyla (strain CBS 200.50) TaxID=1284197 RepID=S8AS66_DACHA|nr:hypothetical protein H072_129 [Dactylellina haptotyla CBS 200.50]
MIFDEVIAKDVPTRSRPPVRDADGHQMEDPKIHTWEIGTGIAFFTVEGRYGLIRDLIRDKIIPEGKREIRGWMEMKTEGKLLTEIRQIDENHYRLIELQMLSQSKRKRDSFHRGANPNEVQSKHRALEQRAAVPAMRFGPIVPHDLLYLSAPPPDAEYDRVPGITRKVEYYYEDTQGAGVDVYVVDTGFSEFGKTHDDYYATGIGWPSKRGADGSLERLVVVGSANSDGTVLEDERENFVKVYAPSSCIMTPFLALNERSSHRSNYQLKNNYSLGVASVAAILANHLSANKDWTVTQAIEKLYKDAYPRIKNGRPIAWTGVRAPTAGQREHSESDDEPKACKGKRKQTDEDDDDTSKKAKLEEGPSGGPAVHRRQDVEEIEDCDDDYEELGIDEGGPAGNFISTRTVLQAYKTQVVSVTRTVEVTATTLVTRTAK